MHAELEVIRSTFQIWPTGWFFLLVLPKKLEYEKNLEYGTGPPQKNFPSNKVLVLAILITLMELVLPCILIL